MQFQTQFRVSSYRVEERNAEAEPNREPPAYFRDVLKRGDAGSGVDIYCKLAYNRLHIIYIIPQQLILEFILITQRSEEEPNGEKRKQNSHLHDQDLILLFSFGGYKVLTFLE